MKNTMAPIRYHALTLQKHKWFVHYHNQLCLNRLFNLEKKVQILNLDILVRTRSAMNLISIENGRVITSGV